jgi:phosphoenolpyruvate-protein kinase (PTS system EI component)
VHVAANLSSVEDARLAAEAGADLAGLVRTEFLFLGRSRAPDVDEQEAEYRRIAEALGGRRITLRTLDVGGDKSLPYVPLPRRRTRSSACAACGSPSPSPACSPTSCWPWCGWPGTPRSA